MVLKVFWYIVDMFKGKHGFYIYFNYGTKTGINKTRTGGNNPI